MRLYLGDFLGWETEGKAKVAISQLREGSIISSAKCPKVQLLKNRFSRYESNFVKFLGYLPIIHFIIGIGAIVANRYNDPNYLRPHHRQFWALRGVAMIVLGPALFIADLIKFIFDCIIVFQYNRTNRHLIQQFNTAHGHTREHWPGHPIYCEDPSIEDFQFQLARSDQEVGTSES